MAWLTILNPVNVLIGEINPGFDTIEAVIVDKYFYILLLWNYSYVCEVKIRIL